MSIQKLNLSSDDVHAAMLRGLQDSIRSELRRRILESIEPDITSAIDAALDGFKASIESYRDPIKMQDTIRVLIERRDIPKRDAP